MKKLSLSNLSKHALDKFQQNSIHGGGLPSCVCAYICDICGCHTEMDGAVYTNEQSGNQVADHIADILGDNPQ